MKRKVKVRYPIAEDQICAVDYCKKFGEHLLATKIVKYRKDPDYDTTFVDELMELAVEHEDSVVI